MEADPPRPRSRAKAIRRTLGWLALLLPATALLAAGLALAMAPDPSYRLHAWLALGRYRAHDALITEAAARHPLDPLLLKALAWRASDFDPRKLGPGHTRGLLQISEPAARDWAAAERIETFMPTDLFDPHTNLRAGAWLLARAVPRYQDRDRPALFALAEFKLGGAGEWSSAKTAAALLSQLDPDTRTFIESVESRRAFYAKHGW